MDKFSPEKRSFIMSRIKGKHTSIEVVVRKRLWEMGHRGYRIHVKKVLGSPDIVYPKKRIAIFIDGDFWHGFILKTRAKKLPEYWLNKIQRNVKRDKKYNRLLTQDGWKVIRIWENEILKNLDGAVSKIVRALA